MTRHSAEYGSNVEVLIDERDDLLVEISMEMDKPKPDPEKLETMHRRVAELVSEIRHNWGVPQG